MSVQVTLPGVLADLAGGSKHLDVDPAGPTLADLLDTLAERHPLLGRRIRDETGEVRRRSTFGLPLPFQVQILNCCL